MVPSNSSSFAEAAQADNETLLNMACMLGSLHTQEDLDIVTQAGITEACFVGADNYGKAFRHIKKCIVGGKIISREYIRRKHKIDLPRSDGNPKDYADLVVFATANAQADEILGKMQEEIQNAEPEDFYEAVATARNALRSLAGPLTGSLALNNGGKTVRYTDKGSMKAPPPQKWLVRGIVPDDWPTFFYGMGGSAKSYLAVLLALGVATGRQFLGTAATERKVLYLDWEMDEPTFRARVNRVAKGMKLSLADGCPNLSYQQLTKPLKEHLDDLIEQVEIEGIGLVIIDSFGFSMTGMDTSAQPDVTTQMGRIAQIPAAVVIIDHISKEGKGELGPFGSIYKHAAARWMWWCRAASKEECPDGVVKPGIFVRMWNAKHNIAAQQKDIYLHIVWDDEFDAKTVTMRRVERDQVPESLTQDIKPLKEKKAKDEISAKGRAVLGAIGMDDMPDGHEQVADKDWILEDTGYGSTAVDKELEYLEAAGEIRKERIRPPKGERPGRGANRYQYFIVAKTVKKDAVDVTEEKKAA